MSFPKYFKLVDDLVVDDGLAGFRPGGGSLTMGGVIGC